MTSTNLTRGRGAARRLIPMRLTQSPIPTATHLDEFLPFSLLTRAVTGKGSVPRAVRTAGESAGCGELRLSAGAASGVALPAAQQAALERALAWLGADADGAYAISLYRGHRAPVEVDGAGLAIDVDATLAIDALALAWAAAIIALKSGSARAALQAVNHIYMNLGVDAQAAMQTALANSDLDAGGLAGLYLKRAAAETSAEELVRWESWFLGQRKVDLPYDRKAVIDIFDADIDPDEKRVLLHDSVVKYDYETERENRARIVADVRAKGQELIFGRMSRAFHNQSLLFANAGYVQVTPEIRTAIETLTAACAGSKRLAPPADRLRVMLQGAAETPKTAVIGALELLEDAILDEQRAAIDGALKAEREGKVPAQSCGAILSGAEKLLGLCRGLRDALLAAARRPAAFVLLSQRLAPLESHLMVRINELQEPYLGKPENLKQLAREGGHRMYSSPDYAWLQQADHWVEAIPLFIKERVLVVDGVEVTETVIDQQILEETFREQFADHWAKGIENVMDSEHVALARELLARTDARLAGDDRARAAAVATHELSAGVGALAAMIAFAYRHFAEMIHLRAEKDGLSRYDTLKTIIQENLATDHEQCLVCVIARQAKANGTGEYDETLNVLRDAPVLDDAVRAEAARLAAIAHMPRRALPTLHVLTTQSARMSDSYVRTWLEESMALGNVIRANGLDGEVRDRMTGYRDTITQLGALFIRELGMWAEVEELMALERLPEGAAIGRIIAGNAVISRQVSLMAVLSEHLGLTTGVDAPLVEALLANKGDALQAQAIHAVYERNDLELLPKMDAYRAAHLDASDEEIIRALILGDADYADDLAAFTHFAAREMAVRELDAADPSLQLAARAGEWLRNHTRLALTTARRETLLAHDLNHLTLHPLYYYRAAGGNKRFNQLYTPSRVDLGTHERESVEKWSQWVGGADRDGSRVGRRVYGLINKNVKMFDSLTEPEVIKTGENASMVANFAYSNAMSLLVNSVGRGDVEDLGDQMSLRKDRLIRPGGEGYGGYCVPKDGLFLEFVLILTRATKLRQLGVADHLHQGIVAFSEYLLSKRGTFSTEIEWEAWAMQMVAERTELNEFFSLRAGADGPVPVFQVTRIAKALTQLGRPELRESFDVLANLAARWSIHKVIVGGEQVNRFMVFFKVWLTYQALEQARAMNPGVPISDDFAVVLQAEYKPNTQDGRYSVGMRKYELFAGTGEHLTYSLDTAGQDLAHLMFHGFRNLWERRAEPRMRTRLTRLLAELQVREDDAASIERLYALFPGCKAPGEIRMVSPMMLTTADLLHYAADTQLEPLAMGVQRRLMETGLTENEISANMLVYGPRLAKWTKIRDMRPAERERLIARIGGDIHALALSIIGPAGNFEMSVQGADVLDTGIPHDELLALLEHPVRVRDMMLEGNPHSALIIMDGASGARHRAMNRLAVMRWFAAGETAGRNAMYRCMGVGADTIESWREEMRHQRQRARLLLDALKSGDAETARERFAAIVSDLQAGQESALFLETEERMLRFGKQTAQEAATARAMAAVAAGLSLDKLDFATWLGLGGQFQLMGATPAELDDARATFEAGIAALGGGAAADDAAIDALFCPAYVPAAETFREEKGVESSNKATEEVAAVAIDTRKRLQERAARAKGMGDREKAFLATLDAFSDKSFAEMITAARMACADESTPITSRIGAMLALTRLGLVELGQQIFTRAGDEEHLELVRAHVETLFTGRDVDMTAIRAISGGYEDPGDIARLGAAVAAMRREGTITDAERDRLLAQVADVAELFDTCRGILLTIDFYVVKPENPTLVWRAMADFFAEFVNDHFYQYRPWSYTRGDGFKHVQGEELYALAVEHYLPVYRYLRTLALNFTELQEYTTEQLAALIGDMDGDGSTVPIGENGETAAERRWRAFTKLREIAFMRNDGFQIPRLFAAFDPAIIEADTRANLVYLYPVGRTHVSRAIMEGPTLTAELQAQGRPGANLLISRHAEEVTLPGFSRPVLQVRHAHVYINRAEYITALKQHQGLGDAQAAALADEHAGPKGVCIAAYFTRPVTVGLIFPMHGHPLYDNGRLEELGLPYSSQSLFHTWTTYDKAKYPAIFCPETGVALPGEIDWLAAWTAEMGDEATKQALEFGDASHGFIGLRKFAEQFRLVMLKDAAESGGRGQKVFALRREDGSMDDAVIADAVEFAYQITLKHNIAMQEVIISSPEYWATEAFLQSFTDRQIQEWGAVVNRTRRPRTAIYGSHRLIFSSSNPTGNEWHVSHPITLNSRQLITNVGRGGTLEIFKPEFIQPAYREQLMRRLVESGEKSMAALARYGDVAAAQYTAETGRAIGCDATGLPYSVPRYMMLDFIVQPVFAEEGTLVDLEPVYDAAGERVGVSYILQRGEERFAGSVQDWRVVLIEPNIGIGLWDRLAIREECYAVRATDAPDWTAVGAQARIVLTDMAHAAEEYLAAITG